MSMLRIIGTGIAWSTLASVLGKAVIFANLFIILRYLTLYEYGLSELVFSTVSLLSIILLPGLSSSVLADLSAHKSKGEIGKTKALFLQFLGLHVVLGMVAWAVLFFGSSLVAAMLGNATVGGYVQVVSFLFLAAPFRAAAVMLASVELRFIDMSFYSVLEEASKGLYLLLFFFGFHLGVDGLLYAAVLAQFTAFVVFLPRTLSAYRNMSAVALERVGNVWDIVRAHRKWGIATSYVNSLVPPLQLWIIRLMLGTEAVGMYAFAYGVYSQLASLLPLQNVLAPIIPRYAGKLRDLVRLLRTSIKLQMVLTLAVLVLAQVSVPVLGFVFPKYAAAIPLTHAMLFAIIPGSVALLYTPVFNALRAQFSLLQSMVVKLLLTVVLFPISILVFGIWGLAAANVLVLAASTAERGWRLNKYFGDTPVILRRLFTVDDDERRMIRLLLDRMPAGRFLLARAR